jgi:hypothetical protein
MQQVWFQGKPQDEHEAIEKRLKSYRAAFEALAEVLETVAEEQSSPNYDKPSWAYRQADVNGANRMLRRVRKIIDIN